ncbi:MAG: N-acetylmuramoyl-L-alanine amidase [Clostridiales bacterium]|nr:N-acetylmuramoyl-L-alanine amidase [Clostridiales bacterium]
MKQKEKLKVIAAVAAILLAITALYSLSTPQTTQTTSDKFITKREKPCVVIDAGHGGIDPGKVGINGALEKDINLEIAKKLQQFLEQEDVEVVLTREFDAGLYDENASNKKVQDMKRRVELIETTKPVVTVSIHQNSYHEEYVHGAQTFYYTGSEQSRILAEKIQQVLLNGLDKDNTREAKANDSYYLLKKTSSPIVIVECGFLSNRDEAQKLDSDYYQEKLAWAIHMGILQYLNEL